MKNFGKIKNTPSEISVMRILQRIKKSDLSAIFSTTDFIKNGFSYNEIILLQKIEVVKKLKNGIYYFDKNEKKEEGLLKNAYIIPFKEGKNIYITGLSSLKLGNGTNKYISLGTVKRGIRPFSVEYNETKINYEITVKNFIPDTKEIIVGGVIIKVASTEQAILDYLDTKRDTSDFDEFIKKIDDIKEQIDYDKILNLAISNNQYEGLSRICYILNTIIDFNFNNKDKCIKYIEKNIKSRIKLDYSGNDGGTTVNDWKIINNLSTSKKIIQRREFNGLSFEYIDKSNIIKLSVPLIELGEKFKKYSPRLDNNQNIKELLMFESYFGNLVEGTVFTLEEALDIMLKQKIPTTRPKNDVYDIQGYFSIYEDFLDGKISLDGNILDLVKLVNKRIVGHKWDIDTGKPAGIFRSEVKDPYNVYVGSSFTPIDFSKLKSLLLFVEKEFSLIDNYFVKAFFIHFFIAEAHPFPDGNGRTARLISNLYLLKGGYIPPLCTPQNKNYIYSKGLSDMTHENNISKLVDYFDKAMKKSYQFIFEDNKMVGLGILKGEFEEDGKDIMRSQINIDEIFNNFFKS